MTEIRTSDQVAELAGALAKAQAEMENVAKDRENPHFRSRYATLGGVLDEVRPKLAKHGIALIQMPVNGEGANIGVVTRLIHSSGQWIESAVYVSPAKYDAQGVGSVLTYLRRYSAMAMGGVGPEDDDGNAAIARPEQRTHSNGHDNAAAFVDGTITSDEADALNALADEVGADKRKFCEYFKVESIAALRSRDYRRAFDALNQKKARMQ